MQQIHADIPADLQHADDLLTRYGRWCVSGRGGAGRCGSAESMYRSPRSAEDRRAPMQLVVPANEAVQVQRALIQVAQPERMVLQVLYVPGRVPAVKKLALLHVPPQLARIRHLAGLRMFANLWRTRGCATIAPI